jgi:hypothetical protein
VGAMKDDYFLAHGRCRPVRELVAIVESQEGSDTAIRYKDGDVHSHAAAQRQIKVLAHWYHSNGVQIW